MAHVTVRLVSHFANLEGITWLELDGGDPKGNDTLHRQVSSWAGWSRIPATGLHESNASSRYRARAWLSALQPLLASGLAIAWEPQAKKWADAQLASYQRSRHALQDTSPSVMVGWPPLGRQPMQHQTQAVCALAEMGVAAGLRDDMGLGKTTSALIAWSMSCKRRLLVVCPKSVKINWLEEIEAVFKHDGDLHTFLIDGSPSNRANVLGYMKNVAVNDSDPGIAIVNYDLLHSMNEIAWRSLELWVSGQGMVCDEFHYCKDLGTKRTKAVQALMNLAKFKLGLTGTPVRNTVEDLFAQIELLRPGTWVSYHDFANRHLVISQVQFTGQKRKVNVVRGGKNLEELNRVVNTLWIGRKKEEVLTLPPLIETKPKLELDGLHLQVYQSMKKFARVQLEKLATDPAMNDAAKADYGGLSIWHPLARSGVEAAMRCEMIAQGFLSGLPPEYAEEIAPLIAGKAERVDGYDGAFVFPDSPKMQWILDVIENEWRDHQVGIISRFNAPLLWLEKRIAKSAKLVGSMDAVARHETIQSFRKGEHRVLGIQVKLAEGFNLTECSRVIFLGRDWSPAINKQAKGRFHRIGSTGTVDVQVPIVANSVEKFIDRKLDAKDSDAEQALKSVTLRELLDAL
jgi:SNF2 family DNA or RNA helicase